MTKDRKNIVNGVGVVVLATVLLFSATMVTATPSLTTHYNLHAQPNDHQAHRDVVWDNGDYIHNALSSQLDTQYPFNSQVADDFTFPTVMVISEVACYGLFYNGGGPNPIDINVLFYNDDGTGTMPTGAGMDDPTPTALQVELHPVVGTDNHDGTYTYDITLYNNFIAQANTKYWIAIQAKFNFPPQWGWCISNKQQLHDCMQGFPLLGTPYWTDPGYGDVSFKLMNVEYQPRPDLDCQGALAWTEVKAGATVNGSFQVMNIGEPNSQLNWTITSYPEWGTWSFTPSSGVNLTPADGPVTVNIEVVAPDSNNQDFQGQIIIVNTDNASDTCTIPVSLTTPLTTGLMHRGFFERLIDQFPRAFPILRFILTYK